MIAFCERYRRAVETCATRGALLAMASARYFLKTAPPGDDDYGYAITCAACLRCG